MSGEGPKNDAKLTRRTAIKILSVGTAGALAHPPANLSLGSDRKEQQADVLVIGAGFAGLTATRNLQRAGKKVVVLEARDRVGGRVMRGTIAGYPIDVGGMFVGPTQTKLIELIKEFGLHTAPIFERGKGVIELNGMHVLAEGEDLGLDSRTQAEYDRLVAKLDALAAQVSLEEPWKTPDAEALDEITLEEWIRIATPNETLRAFFRSQARINLAADSYAVSFLFFLFYLKSSDNFETLNGYKNGAQAMIVKETIYEVAARIGAELGTSIILQAPVRAVKQDATGVTVVCDKGTWRAEYAIVAVPLPLSVRMAFEPPLPPQRDILAQHMPMGSVIKCLVAYEKPFWRARGLNGLTWTDTGPSVAFTDISPNERGPGFLVTFIEAHNAMKWTGRPVEERKKLIVERVSSLLGPEGAYPIDYIDHDWPAEQWSRGCYEPYTGPGVLTTVGKYIREPHGKIHWAGTETSSKWMGYVDGAIRSGERAGQEILVRYSRK